MPPEEFKLTIPASEWPYSHALDRQATAIGLQIHTAVMYGFSRGASNLTVIMRVMFNSL
jgi:hypothetical protein